MWSLLSHQALGGRLRHGQVRAGRPRRGGNADIAGVRGVRPTLPNRAGGRVCDDHGARRGLLDDEAGLEQAQAGSDLGLDGVWFHQRQLRQPRPKRYSKHSEGPGFCGPANIPIPCCGVGAVAQGRRQGHSILKREENTGRSTTYTLWGAEEKRGVSLFG
eukprot:scaffold633_cov321-Pavlova_lutheri.AAC.45